MIHYIEYYRGELTHQLKIFDWGVIKPLAGNDTILIAKILMK